MIEFCAVSPVEELRSEIDSRIRVRDLGVARVRCAGPKLAGFIREGQPKVILSTLGLLNLLLLIRPFLGGVRIYVRGVNTLSVDLRLGSHSAFLRIFLPMM